MRSQGVQSPPREGDALRLRIDEAPAALERLRQEWSALCDRCRFTTPFQRPEWLLPWMAHFGPREPWIGLGRDGARLVTLAPLFVYGIRRREVALLGAGLSDYLDLLCEPGLEDAAGAAVMEALAARRGRWDRCHFHDLREHSPLCNSPAPGRDRLERGGVWAVLDLDDGDGGELGWLRPRRRKAVRAAVRRASRRGKLSLERADAGNWPDTWLELERLHALRWRARGGDGMLADVSVRRFHRAVAEGFAARDALGLYALRLGGRVVAALYGLEEGDTFYYYLSGFDPALGSLGPGNLVVALAADDAARRGLRRFDFLRGQEAYKRAWGAREVASYRRVLERD